MKRIYQEYDVEIELRPTTTGAAPYELIIIRPSTGQRMIVPGTLNGLEALGTSIIATTARARP